MFKKLSLLIVLSVICFGVQAQSVKIYKQRGKNLGNIVVHVNTGGLLKAYWLGVTYKLDGGQEHDFKAVRVRGKRKKNFSIGMVGGALGMLQKSGKITWTVRLWTRKVKKSNCTKAGCRWCMLMGYHLEGLVTQDHLSGSL